MPIRGFSSGCTLRKPKTSGPVISNPDYYDGSLLKGEKKKKGRRPMAASSEKQDVRQAFLAGIKAERLRAQSAVARPLELPFRCEGCSRGARGPEDLDLHHVIGRDKGIGYRPSQGPGVDAPTNLKLLCRPCHEKTEPSPQWKGPSEEGPDLDAA